MWLLLSFILEEATKAITRTHANTTNISILTSREAIKRKVSQIDIQPFRGVPCIEALWNLLESKFLRLNPKTRRELLQWYCTVIEFSTTFMSNEEELVYLKNRDHRALVSKTPRRRHRIPKKQCNDQNKRRRPTSLLKNANVVQLGMCTSTEVH